MPVEEDGEFDAPNLGGEEPQLVRAVLDASLAEANMLGDEAAADDLRAAIRSPLSPME